MVSEEAVTDLKGNAVTPPLLKHVHHDTAENCRKCHKTNIQKNGIFGYLYIFICFFPQILHNDITACTEVIQKGMFISINIQKCKTVSDYTNLLK